MNKSYPVEALLRPPIELWSAFCAFGIALTSALAPWAIMMTPSVGYASALLLAWFGVISLLDALHILLYQLNMRRMPEYVVEPKNIPVSRRCLFLGKGFLWRQQHTQGLRDTLNPKVRHYVEPSALYRWARRMESQWEHSPALNPVAKLLDVIRRGILITQDIARGETVIVFDPKGDADLMKRVVAEAKRAGHGDETYIFHLGCPDISCRYNAIGNFSRITEVATRLTDVMPSGDNSAVFRI